MLDIVGCGLESFDNTSVQKTKKQNGKQRVGLWVIATVLQQGGYDKITCGAFLLSQQPLTLYGNLNLPFLSLYAVWRILVLN